MSIRTWAISFILVGSLLGLAGCAEKTNGNEAELENKVTELEKKLEEQKAAEEAARKAAEEAEAKRKAEEEANKPKVVNVVDPTTKNIIKSLIPVDMGYGTDNEKYKQELENWAKDLARGTDTTPGYDTKMMLDKIDANGQVIKGKARVILEEAELVNKIIEASVKGGDVFLPIYVTESGYKPEDAAHLSEVVVATYTTKFNPSITGRNKNIELSAQAIDNVIVGTGDIFSFNYTVGPSDEAHGYQPAQEIVNKELVMGIGGGICQTSSTLFNAVDQLAIEYVEWHHHSLTVGYVPSGRDATVSYGGKDFQFKNTAGVPLLVKATYNPNGTLTVEMRTSAAYQALLQKR
ncbi:VanW family protein [Neobacillus sp. 3P2-tot-E-2]|uniref:VanW family protein n=1 Tax=Neobacillus sp. 3P2-tot-E-2 TaxID=3132212 RepID=UPI0039A1F0CA